MNIGNILPDQKVIIKISLIILNEIVNGAYCFKLPSAYSPK
jgi:hypothetical protein